MKLLYVCADFGIPPSGRKGASLHLRAITEALCDLGHEVSLLSPGGEPGGQHPVHNVLPAERCGPTDWAEQLRKWLKDRDLPHAVAQELRPLLFNTWATPRVLEVLQRDPPDAIIERLSLFSHVGLDLARALKRPFLVEVNALLSREARQFRKLELVGLAEAVESRVLNEANVVMPVSDQLAKLVTSVGVPESKIRVVPNGANVEEFDPASDGMEARRRLNLNGEFVVGFAGSLKSWHGVDVLVEAFEQLLIEDPSAKLLIVGSGPTEAKLRSAAADVGRGDSVLFTGAVDHHQVPGYLSAMDVTVAPFRKVEDFYFSPIKLFEYMAAGRCIVASRLGQIEEVIVDGHNGLLCQPDDAHSLAAALLQARLNDSLRQRLGSTARRCVEENYTWKRAARTVDRLIREQMGTHSEDAAGSRPVSFGKPAVGH